MNKSDSAPILIVGTGAMACLFAARLAAGGVAVHILGTWAEGLAALNRDGVRLLQPDGSELRFKVVASADPSDFAVANSALVLVKSWQTERAADQLFKCLALDGVALTLQNGLGNREKLMARLGSERVASGVTTLGATLVGPGSVRSGGEGTISIEDHPRISLVVAALQSADFAVDLVHDVVSLAWSKLVVNAAINPLAAILDIPNGELLTRPTARELSAALAREVAKIAAKKGVHLVFPDPVQAAESVAKSTAMNYSSMLQDLQRNAPTEIDAICGAVVMAGREIGIPAPINETMWKLVTAKKDKP